MKDLIKQTFQKVGSGDMKPMAACALLKAEQAKDVVQFDIGFQKSDFLSDPVARKGYDECIAASVKIITQSKKRKI